MKCRENTDDARTTPFYMRDTRRKWLWNKKNREGSALRARERKQGKHIDLPDRRKCLQVIYRHHMGVDNGAAGAAAAAPIIWLDVVIQKWRAFRRPTRSVNVSAGLLGRGHNGCVVI